ELDDIRQFVVVDEADPSAVLEGISYRRELLLTLRDIAVLNGRLPTVWILFGSQMRRFASSVASKSRTHYFALLIEAARRHGRLPAAATEFITDMLQGGGLGKTRHIVTSQATYRDGIWSLKFRFMERKTTIGTTERFRLSIDADGPFITTD
ncbi:hypothetical protein Q9L58_010915, partial [Maublancomyces gigas]